MADPMLNLAIAHYHLNRGGVAQVVLNHLQSLHSLPDHLLPQKILLLYGGRRQDFPVDLTERFSPLQILEVVIPELDYDEGSTEGPQPQRLANRLESALRDNRCAADDTVLHIHNHALGKNLSLPGAVASLAERGFGLLLHTHDFAEDFRPANYGRLQQALEPQGPESLTGLLYPRAPQIHYAVLNHRDWSVFRDAGVDERNLHFLPNPIPPPLQQPDRSAARQRLDDRFGIGKNKHYVLYPVRGIRRKNLGEALLWAAAAGSSVEVGFTLPPLNPVEKSSYDRWRWLASDLKLACHFEVGGESGLSLADNFAACDRLLTTSVAEGFGLVFLEAWLVGRGLVGRDLPEITSDFVQGGMTFTGLRPRVDVPIDWIDKTELLDLLTCSYNAALAAYGREPLTRLAVAEGLEGKLNNGCIDFGDLSAQLQEAVLRKVCGNSSAMETLVRINPFLDQNSTSLKSGSEAEIQRNAAIVSSQYSLEVSARRLLEIYQRVMVSPRGSITGLENGERILNFFLSLPRFRPVRL